MMSLSLLSAITFGIERPKREYVQQSSANLQPVALRNRGRNMSLVQGYNHEVIFHCQGTNSGKFFKFWLNFIFLWKTVRQRGLVPARLLPPLLAWWRQPRAYLELDWMNDDYHNGENNIEPPRSPDVDFQIKENLTSTSQVNVNNN